MAKETNLIIENIPTQLEEIDIDLLFNNLIGPTIACVNALFLGKSIINLRKAKIILKKDFDPTELKEIRITPTLRNECVQIDKKRLANLYLGNKIINFTEVITKNIPKEELTNFYNNINNLKTYARRRTILVKKRSSGSYLPEDNTITLKEEKSIYHELFHMASARSEGDINYVGFSQFREENNYFKRVGHGINEGYTEYLTHKYFPKDRNYLAYVYEQLIAKVINDIIGEDKMRKLYLGSDLFGLIQELSKYDTEENAMDFINALDFICSCEQINRKDVDKEKQKSSLICINKFLFRQYSKNLIERQNSNNEKDISKKMAEFVRYMTMNLMMFYATDDDQIGDIMVESLKMGLEDVNIEYKDFKIL